MSDQDPIAETDRPDCAVGQAALQRMLDGEAAWDAPEAAAHRSACVACREELVLAGSLAHVPDSVIVPSELSSKLLDGVLKSQRQRRFARFAGAGVTLAASILVFVIAFRPPGVNQPEPVVVALVPVPSTKIEPRPPVEPQKPLGESMGEARDAIVHLTQRKASETRDTSARLLSEPKLPNSPDAGAGLEPLADARTGAEKSVEPIRTSARRAFNMFIRAADPPERRPQP